MESLIPGTAILRDILNQARKLNSTCLTLNNLLAEEASYSNRQDEASRLRALHVSISQQVDEAKRMESAARRSYKEAELVTSLTGLAVGVTIRLASQDKRALAFSDNLLKNLGGKERPFSTVLVSIGSKGLPDDAGVVSISELARKSNREESKVISELRERGHLLLSKEEFSLLIDKVVIGVQEGWLHLPISNEKLSEITLSSQSTLRAKKIE